MSAEAGYRGPTAPLQAAPARRPGSVRRTSTIDTTWPGGLTGDMVVHGRARDLRTGVEGDGEVVSASELRARVAADRTLTEIDGPDPRLRELEGASTFRRFRAATAAALPDLDDSATPLRLLIDDFPLALLVSGMALMPDADDEDGGGTVDERAGGHDPSFLDSQIGVCAGWARSSSMVEVAIERGQTPTPVTVPSPPLDDADDPLAWHEAPLPDPVATRRRRLLDVSIDPGAPEVARVSALFRDSHIGTDGVERSFHEYTVDAAVDLPTRTITAIDARHGVLPWAACPQALASADRVVGTSIDDLRAQVRTTFRGTSTCTHLNDVLAAMGDTSVLVDLLDP